MPAASPTDLPLSGYRIGMTAGRKVEQQRDLLERRGAEVVWAPALAGAPDQVDDVALRAATERVAAGPVDLLLATTGVGLKGWFAAAEAWGSLDRLLATLGSAEILARGPKSVGALRRFGLREEWSPASEALEDVLAHLEGRDLTGLRVVLQEHGQPLASVAAELEARGAEVTGVVVYRVVPAADPGPMLDLIDQVVDRRVQAVTFTAAPAVTALMDAAIEAGRAEEVAAALRADVVAACVGPVTAAAFESWAVPAISPDRFRLVAMVRRLETELARRAAALGGADTAAAMVHTAEPEDDQRAGGS